MEKVNTTKPMLLKSITKTTTKSAYEIWLMYTDVKNWKSWDPSVESSEVFGEFVEGTKGTLKPVGGPKTDFVITTLTKYIYFANRSNLPLAHIDFEHAIFDNGEIREVTHTVKLGGFLSPIFKIILGKSLTKDLELAVNNICK
jgi:hypothetical protein